MGWADEKTDTEKLLDICDELLQYIQNDSDHGSPSGTLISLIADLRTDQATKRTKKLDAISKSGEMMKKIAAIQ